MHRDDGGEGEVTYVLPLVMMVLFSALFIGVYAWMRRPSFGESKRRQEKHGR